MADVVGAEGLVVMGDTEETGGTEVTQAGTRDLEEIGGRCLTH